MFKKLAEKRGWRSHLSWWRDDRSYRDIFSAVIYTDGFYLLNWKNFSYSQLCSWLCHLRIDVISPLSKSSSRCLPEMYHSAPTIQLTAAEASLCFNLIQGRGGSSCAVRVEGQNQKEREYLWKLSRRLKRKETEAIRRTGSEEEEEARGWNPQSCDPCVFDQPANCLQTLFYSAAAGKTHICASVFVRTISHNHSQSP